MLDVKLTLGRYRHYRSLEGNKTNGPKWDSEGESEQGAFQIEPETLLGV